MVTEGNIDIDSTKSPNDKLSYKLFTLENQLQVLVIRDNPADSQHHCNDDGSEDYSSGEDYSTSGEEGSHDEDGSSVEDDGNSSSRKTSTASSSDQKKTKRRTHHRKLSACCLSVGVGGYSDPEKLPGLAHYLEHMLFMGSSKYPDENAFDAFLNKHGGHTNGCTDGEITTYIFEVSPKYLQEAMDMFAQFFICPLMKKDAMDRELSAVDSEFQEALNKDSVRNQELRCRTSKEGHVCQRFFWGNNQSLRVQPLEAKIDVYQEVNDFYRKEYSANIMQLVVYGEESLEVMESWVRESFSPIVNHQVPMKSFEHLGSPFAGSTATTTTTTSPPTTSVTNQTNPRLFRIIPIKEMHDMNICWSLPPLLKHYHQRPTDYIAHLLGHESEGSLLCLLKDMGWASNVHAGVSECDGNDNGTSGCIFTFTFKLTLKGLSKYKEIIAIVYEYLKLIKEQDYPEWIFDELVKISDLNFCFQEPMEPIVYVEELAWIMQRAFCVQPQDILTFNCLKGPFQRDLLGRVADHFTLDNMRVYLSSSTFALEKEKEVTSTWLSEPWFGVQYQEEPLPSCETATLQIKEWVSKLHLPLRNPFIPQDFQVLECSKETLPRLILDTPDGKLWYHQDAIFKIPRAFVCIELVTPFATSSTRHLVLSELFVKAVNHSLMEYSYLARLAELQYSFRIKENSFQLKVGGFHDKIPILLEAIAKAIAQLSITDQRFDILLDDLQREYKNLNLQSNRKATYKRMEFLKKEPHTVENLRSLVTQVTKQDLVDFHQSQLFQQLHLRCYVDGNLLEKQALEFYKIVETHFITSKKTTHKNKNNNPIQSTTLSTNNNNETTDLVGMGAPKIYKLIEDRQFVLDYPADLESETNSAVEMYFQIGKLSVEWEVYADLVAHMMQEPLFDCLRTREQLGYSVHCGVRLTSGILGFAITVQSSSFSGSYVHQRINAFMEEFHTLLVDMDTSTFENHVSALMVLTEQRDNTLEESAMRHWEEVVNRRCNFQLRADKIAILEKLTKNTILDNYHLLFSKKLIARIIAPTHQHQEPVASLEKQEQLVQGSLQEAKQTLECYPSFY